IVPERRIRHTIKFYRRIDRKMPQHDRSGQPPPDRRDRCQGNKEKCQRNTKGNWLACPEDALLICQVVRTGIDIAKGQDIDLYQKQVRQVKFGSLQAALTWTLTSEIMLFNRLSRRHFATIAGWSALGLSSGLAEPAHVEVRRDDGSADRSQVS